MSETLFELSAGDRVELSGTGAARREAIGHLLSREAGARRRKRMVVRTAVACVPLVVLAITAWALIPPAKPSPAPVEYGAKRGIIVEAAPKGGTAPALREAAPANAIRTVIVRTDVGILERYAAEAGPSRVERISDLELSLLLAEAGHEPGVIRAGSNVIVVAAAEVERAQRRH